MIYILEDDENIRKLISYTLQSQGYQCTGFEKPSHFWEVLKTPPPELLLLNIMLPEEDGISILKKLRQNSSYKSIPVIMLADGDLKVDICKHTVFVKSQQVFLTVKEFDLLTLLLQNRGNVITREQLLDSVWKIEANIESRTVDVHIKTLRQKLETAGDLIETIRGVGYCIK